MPLPIDQIKKLLTENSSVTLTCSGPSPFENEIGYIGQVFEDSFEFLQVTNKYEHFSNISAEPKLRANVIEFAHVIQLTD
jgi:hypothetical protein